LECKTETIIQPPSIKGGKRKDRKKRIQRKEGNKKYYFKLQENFKKSTSSTTLIK
jgi:hypothetical protein